MRDTPTASATVASVTRSLVRMLICTGKCTGKDALVKSRRSVQLLDHEHLPADLAHQQTALREARALDAGVEPEPDDERAIACLLTAAAGVRRRRAHVLHVRVARPGIQAGRRGEGGLAGPRLGVRRQRV